MPNINVVCVMSWHISESIQSTVLWYDESDIAENQICRTKNSVNCRHLKLADLKSLALMGSKSRDSGMRALFSRSLNSRL